MLKRQKENQLKDRRGGCVSGSDAWPDEDQAAELVTGKQEGSSVSGEAPPNVPQTASLQQAEGA